MRIVAVGISGTGLRQDDTGLLTLLHDHFGTAAHGIQGNEVSPLRIGPVRDA